MNSEILHVRDTLIFERELKNCGYSLIAGVDEAGRGPLAGPVVAAACILPEGLWIEGLDDSKKLTPMKREKMFEFLQKASGVFLGVGIVEAAEIDEINILQATFKAMELALNNLEIVPEFALVDGSMLPRWELPSRAIVKGDSLSASISAASIVAKQTRDAIMDEMETLYPGYGFAKHKGYGTKAHLQAISLLGPCPIHRKTFEPIKSIII